MAKVSETQTRSQVSIWVVRWRKKSPCSSELIKTFSAFHHSRGAGLHHRTSPQVWATCSNCRSIFAAQTGEKSFSTGWSWCFSAASFFRIWHLMWSIMAFPEAKTVLYKYQKEGYLNNMKLSIISNYLMKGWTNAATGNVVEPFEMTMIFLSRDYKHSHSHLLYGQLEWPIN